jgi:hypothetical protein
MLKTPSRYLARNTVIESKETSYGKCHHVQLFFCSHIFEWKIDHHMTGKTADESMNNSYDVMPVLPTFNGIDYDPYMAYDKVLVLLSSQHQQQSCDVFYEIVKILVESIVSDQKEKVKLLPKSSR